jgi:predicted glutamine amidotransferase
MLAVDPTRFADIHGSTDTEVVFYLALAFGLEDDPIEALERTGGFIETTAGEHGVSAPVQASFGVADGERLWAVRYATEGVPRSLFASTEVATIRQLHPDNPRLQRLSSDDRLIVSEPFSDLPGLWKEIEPSTAVIVRRGGVLEHRPFRPRAEGPPRVARQFAGTADG